MTNKTFNILSIEDNEPDFMLLKEALLKIPNISINIININNGQKALDYIFKKKEYKKAITPQLIILDINLPKVNGHEILKRIKKSRKYKAIPVIIFSGLETKEDIQKSYEEYANSYITKNYDLEPLLKKITTMGEYWLKTSEIPKINDI